MLALRALGVSVHSRNESSEPLGLLTLLVGELQHKSLWEKMLHERYYNFSPARLASFR